ncbi:hypothetical protein PCC7424_5361 (plasmid) [Gloeothece citriformis PCC 7424]|uniref:Uncharacterized protein n=1 Tax=Gloeothece citriformis (strain PCC 7424) TaxID=65393 RepID=B7KMC2_GLOC7|nr:hypothetical protein [Gloeothece citriformis]ACK73944.1 hypothetical protein PCC7424_5361 [Gloeothece citriformis PCC 7424]
MTSSIIATYSLEFSAFLKLAPSLRNEGAKFYTEAEGSNRILKFTKLPLQAQGLLPFAEPEFNKIKEEASSETSITPQETVKETVTPNETVEELSTPVIEEESTTVDVIYLSTEELSKLTKTQLTELAANNNIDLLKSVKSRKNLLVEFLANKIPAN